MLSKTHMMLDIETLDNGPQAAVVAIGARLFTIENGPSKGFEVFISPTIALDFGTRGQSTMEWWQKQPTRDQVMAGQLHSAEALHRLNQFVELHKPEYVWANAPTFDCVILRHLYGQVDLKFPFTYRQERCFRTLKALGDTMGVDLEGCWSGKQAHLPCDDATAQAMAASRILTAILSTPAVLAEPDSDLPRDVPEPHSPATGKTLRLRGR